MDFVKFSKYWDRIFLFFWQNVPGLFTNNHVSELCCVNSLFLKKNILQVSANWRDYSSCFPIVAWYRISAHKQFGASCVVFFGSPRSKCFQWVTGLDSSLPPGLSDYRVMLLEYMHSVWFGQRLAEIMKVFLGKNRSYLDGSIMLVLFPKPVNIVRHN